MIYMKTFIPLLYLMFAACGPALPGVDLPSAFSECGISYRVDDNGPEASPRAPPKPWHDWSGQDALAAETLAIEILDPLFPNACQRLSGTVVLFEKPTAWMSNGRDLAGWAGCGDNPIVLVGSYRESWNETMFVHEMVHILQKCNADAEHGVDFDHDSEHANWSRTGIDAALKSYGMQ